MNNYPNFKHHFFMKKLTLLIISLFAMIQLFAQIYVYRDEFYWKKVKTNDELYIYNDSDKYLMSISPLSHFDGYKTAYQNNNFLNYPVLISSELGTSGHTDKVYLCIWLIKNKQLYLANIFFNDSEIDDVEKGRKDRFPIMEQYTGKKFDQRYNMLLGGREIYGLMSATWLTDTLFVKKAFNSQKGLDYESFEKKYEEWMKCPYHQLIFEKGKLMDMKDIPNATKKSEFVRQKKTKDKSN